MNKKNNSNFYKLQAVSESWIKKSICSLNERENLLKYISDFIYLNEKIKDIGLLGLYEDIDKYHDPNSYHKCDRFDYSF